MGRQKGIPKTQRKHPDATSPGRTLKKQRKVPSWLLQRSKPDPVLNTATRQFLNSWPDVIYYSDSTGTLNVQVKEGTSKKSKMDLRSDLMKELKKCDRPQKFSVQEGRPFVLCSQLPLDLNAAGDESMYRKVGIYLRARPLDGSGGWRWHLISVYHLVHRVCREGGYLWDDAPWPSPYIKMHRIGVEFRKRRDSDVNQHDVVSHHDGGRHSIAVIDAKKTGAPLAVADDAGQMANFYHNHYFSVDILAIRAKHQMAVDIENDKTRGDLVQVNILTVPLPATNELPAGTRLLALPASKGHPPFEGRVEEATATSDLELKYNDDGHADSYHYERLLRYRFDRWGNHQPDDCGTPIFTTDGGETKLLAFHIARKEFSRSGMGLYAFHNINAVFPPDRWEVEAYAPRCVTDPESGYYSQMISTG